MERKRYAAPEAVLDKVVRAIERDDAASHRQAVLWLLSHGPLIVTEGLLDVLDNRLPPEDVMLFRAELLAFLRTVVREEAQGRFSGQISIYNHVQFAANMAGARVFCMASGNPRDLALLQLVMLLNAVGLGTVRVCADANCRRLFVKTYRREFCSERCQKRINQRKQRQVQREKRERDRTRRRQKKGV